MRIPAIGATKPSPNLLKDLKSNKGYKKRVEQPKQVIETQGEREQKSPQPDEKDEPNPEALNKQHGLFAQAKKQKDKLKTLPGLKPWEQEQQNVYQEPELVAALRQARLSQIGNDTPQQLASTKAKPTSGTKNAWWLPPDKPKPQPQPPSNTLQIEAILKPWQVRNHIENKDDKVYPKPEELSEKIDMISIPPTSHLRSCYGEENNKTSEGIPIGVVEETKAALVQQIATKWRKKSKKQPHTRRETAESSTASPDPPASSTASADTTTVPVTNTHHQLSIRPPTWVPVFRPDPTTGSHHHEPAGYRIQESYDRPPPNFAVAVPVRSRPPPIVELPTFHPSNPQDDPGTCHPPGGGGLWPSNTPSILSSKSGLTAVEKVKLIKHQLWFLLELVKARAKISGQKASNILQLNQRAVEKSPNQLPPPPRVPPPPAPNTSHGAGVVGGKSDTQQSKPKPRPKRAPARRQKTGHPPLPPIPETEEKKVVTFENLPDIPRRDSHTEAGNDSDYLSCYEFEQLLADLEEGNRQLKKSIRNRLGTLKPGDGSEDAELADATALRELLEYEFLMEQVNEILSPPTVPDQEEKCHDDDSSEESCPFDEISGAQRRRILSLQPPL